ncbi:MAG: alpha/beta hydrolase fold domain-containing protein, partial [Acidimicrobiales bacterium]
MAHLPRGVVVAVSAPVYRLSLNAHRTVAMQRRLSEASVRLNRVPRGTRVNRLLLGGRPAERVTLGAPDPASAVLYLHGGGYVLGSARMYRPLAAHLSRSAGAVVHNLDYRLAPEHRYPAALEDAVAAFDQLVEQHGYEPSRIAIAGDSAGGGLAVAAARRLTDAGRRPAALALLSPWT